MVFIGKEIAFKRAGNTKKSWSNTNRRAAVTIKKVVEEWRSWNERLRGYYMRGYLYPGNTGKFLEINCSTVNSSKTIARKIVSRTINFSKGIFLES